MDSPSRVNTLTAGTEPQQKKIMAKRYSGKGGSDSVGWSEPQNGRGAMISMSPTVRERETRELEIAEQRLKAGDWKEHLKTRGKQEAA